MVNKITEETEKSVEVDTELITSSYLFFFYCELFGQQRLVDFVLTFYALDLFS